MFIRIYSVINIIYLVLLSQLYLRLICILHKANQ